METGWKLNANSPNKADSLLIFSLPTWCTQKRASESAA